MIPKLVWFIVLTLFTLQTFASTEHNLTEAFAKRRKAQVSQVAYAIKMDFDGTNAFEGNVRIKISLNKTNESLVLDSQADKVKKVSVNGKEIKEYQYSNGTINIPAKFLAAETLIEIDFRKTIGGASFIWFNDSQDGKPYFYTNLEPFGLNEVFPCFDQPDLKATFELSVKGPKEWIFIANEKVRSRKTTDKLVEISFHKTLPISPYLFFISGGPYVEFSDEFNGLPMKIYARHSLKDSVDAEAIFDMTKRGLVFFEEYFDYPYPFSKYDHIFVPNFSSSGMENPGAITLNERFIFNDTVPESQHLLRENLIYHEMAHIWFGDLVTMKWWDDLWLNESFATFMAYLAQEKISKEPNKWILYENTMMWARHTDDQPSTHAIVNLIPDIITAESSFDGITYGKGAASLKQLFFLAGEETFKKGIRAYFKKFAFKNTELRNFIEAIDVFSSENLSEWGNRWFKTKGLNRIEVNLKCGNGKISQFEVLQTPSIKGNETPHKTSFGFYRYSQESLKLLKKVSLKYSGLKTNFPQLIGSGCPDFIMPNQDIHDYGIFGLDPNSRKYRKLALAKLPDSISRLQLWSGLVQDVVDGAILPEEFFDTASFALKKETNGTILAILLGLQKSPHNILKKPFYHYLTLAEREKISLKLEKILFNRVINADHFTDTKLALFDLYLFFSRSSLSQQRLLRLLTKGDNIKGIKLTQELRWNVIQSMAYNGYPKAVELIISESKKDLTFSGQLMKNVSLASLPDFANKKNLWSHLLNLELPYGVMVRAAENFHHPDHPGETLNKLKEYFLKMQGMDWDANKSLIYYFLEKHYPHAYCTEDVVDMSRNAMSKAKLNLYAERIWGDNQATLERCARIRKRAISFPREL